jgi:hypothetical protein
MKALLLSTALAGGFALPALAQDAPSSPFQTEAMGPSVAASDVIGARLYASESALDAEAYAGVQDGWTDIGEVNDIILGRDGSVDAVLVDIGGFLGIGERQVAVDMAALRFVQDDATDADDWFLVLEADRGTLEGAPEWTVPGAMSGGDAASIDEGAAVTDPALAQPAADAGAASDTKAGTGPADGMALPEGYAAVERTALTAELLTGASVHDQSDNAIAEVSDLVLTADGQVTDVVLDVGGFLGIGAKTVALPMDRITVGQPDGGPVRLWVDMTKEDLEAQPEYVQP